MCRSIERLTPFTPRTLSTREKENLQRSFYTMHNITNHKANEHGLRSWTREHKQVWELERLGTVSTVN
jgi:hypothetical protein